LQRVVRRIILNPVVAVSGLKHDDSVPRSRAQQLLDFLLRGRDGRSLARRKFGAEFGEELIESSGRALDQHACRIGAAVFECMRKLAWDLRKSSRFCYDRPVSNGERDLPLEDVEGFLLSRVKMRRRAATWRHLGFEQAIRAPGLIAGREHGVFIPDCGECFTFVDLKVNQLSG